MAPRVQQLFVFAAIAVSSGGCDLLSKSWAEENLTYGGEPMASAFDWLQYSLAYNQGTAFSVFGDLGFMRTVLGVVSLGAALGMAYYIYSREVSRVDAVGLGLIAGGAIGNGYDRLFRIAPNGETGVVDFISMELPWYGTWPTYNIADALILVGVGIYLIGQIIASRNAAAEAPS